MDINYLQFKRPDGTRFNKLPTITQAQFDQYLADGCELIQPRRPASRSRRPATVPKKRSPQKGAR